MQLTNAKQVSWELIGDDLRKPEILLGLSMDDFLLGAVNEVHVSLGKKQLIIPASALKELVRILGATKATKITLFLPSTGSQVVLRCENVQIVSQLIDGKFPDYQAILPKGHKTRTVVNTSELLKACKQAGIIPARAAMWCDFTYILEPIRPGKSSCWPNPMRPVPVRSSWMPPLKARNWRSHSM